MSVDKARLLKAGRGTWFGPEWQGVRCLAKTRAGTPCKNPAITGKERCRMHGGKSTGPRTAEGKARIAAAHLVHGRRTRARDEARKQAWSELRRIERKMRQQGFL